MGTLFSRRSMLGAAGAAVLVPTALSQTASAAANPSGPLVTMSKAVRLFDSRQTTPTWTAKKLVSGQSVGVTIGANANSNICLSAFVNVTITQTVGSGFLIVRPSDAKGDEPYPDTSNINWTAPGLTVANLVLTAVGFENYIEIRAMGSGSTHVIVDLQGYVPFIG